LVRASTPPTHTRRRSFDVLCVVRDIVDPVQDQRLAEFVVGSHARSHPDGAEDDQQQQQVQPQDPDILPQDLLRKYITYAKQQVRPSLSSVSCGCQLVAQGAVFVT
jgi:DNA replication licensing factor MCM2